MKWRSILLLQILFWMTRLMLYFPFSRHLSKYKSDIPFEEKQLVPPKAKPSLARTKNGYLWYAEHRTFGTTWMRLYFCITKGILVSPDVSGERERWGGGREKEREGRRERGEGGYCTHHLYVLILCSSFSVDYKG